MLVYLTEEAFASATRAPVGGGLDDLGGEDPGRLQATAGRIAILPLDNVDIGFDDPQPQAFSSPADTLQKPPTATGSESSGVPVSQAQPIQRADPLPFAGANSS
ncbi:MAG: hypothetical protein WCI65_01865, partial [Synechococcaceae cyanobacterium ELA263]